MVVVYTRPSCVQCDATKRTLTKYNVPHEVRQIEDHPEVLQEARDSGMLTAPYVVHGEQRWAGFNLERIKEAASLVAA